MVNGKQRIGSDLLGPVKGQAEACVWLVTALALTLVYLGFGQADFLASKVLPALGVDALGDLQEWWAVLAQFTCAFVLFFLLPLGAIKLFSQASLGELGLGLGDKRFGFGFVLPLGVLFLAIPSGLSTWGMESFQAEYPLAKLAVESPGRFVLYQLAYGLLYYVAYEAFFRGFLQLGLARKLGHFPALLIQTSVTTLFHLGKPLPELWSALFAGLFFGLLVIRTRSIWPLVLVHWALGVVTDLVAAYGTGLI
ncbi:MAG: CPBP family intramembrane metalloprotease [Deltaproteobacteria bacterium]|nr:CPBP family intramembrane metalloprotease [Deltaproteobacteria bacterium]